MTVFESIKASAFCALYRSFKEREGVMMTGLTLAVEAVRVLQRGHEEKVRRRRIQDKIRKEKQSQKNFESSLELMGLNVPHNSTLIA